MSFFRKLFRFKQQKDISELTDFLANNEAFKNAAKSVHEKTKGVHGGMGLFSKLDSYLEKELLPEDYHKTKKGEEIQKGPPKQIQHSNQHVYPHKNHGQHYKK